MTGESYKTTAMQPAACLLQKPTTYSRRHISTAPALSQEHVASQLLDLSASNLAVTTTHRVIWCIRK